MEKRGVAVIGLGSFGSSVASELARFGDHVLGIDEDEARVSALTGTLSRTVIADARDERALEEAGLGSYEIVVVAMATRLECSILSVMNARSLGVGSVWAKAANATHARILERLGADRILQPEQQFGIHIAHLLHNSAVSDYIRLTKNLHVATVTLPERFTGRPVGKLPLEKVPDLRLLGVLRESAFHERESIETLRQGDVLMLLGPRSAIRSFADRY